MKVLDAMLARTIALCVALAPIGTHAQEAGPTVETKQSAERRKLLANAFIEEHSIRAIASNCKSDCLAELVVLPLVKPDSLSCSAPTTVLPESFREPRTSDENAPTPPETYYAIQAAAVTYVSPADVEDEKAATVGKTSIYNVLLAIPAKGPEAVAVCWPTELPFDPGMIHFELGTWMSEEEYIGQYHSSVGLVGGIIGNFFGGSEAIRPLRCVWQGCSELQILEIEVSSSPAGMGIFLDGAKRLLTNSSFSVSKRSFGKLRIGADATNSKPLTDCQSKKLSSRRYRFSC